jgi:hypothetical protein
MKTIWMPQCGRYQSPPRRHFTPTSAKFALLSAIKTIQTP